MSIRRFLILLLCVVALVLVGAAAVDAAPQHQPAQRLKVVTKVFEPLVFKRGDHFTGFSIDLWDAVAREINADYDFVEVTSVTDQLKMVADGNADVAIAGISMTPEREQIIDFSHPYFNAGLQILTSTTSGSFGFVPSSVISAILSPTWLEIIAIGLVIAIVMAHAIWLVERKTNPDFQHGYFRGIWEGLWWLLNIVANGEYGDKATRSVAKRLITIFWWLIGVVLIANFTASITTALTVQQLNGSISGPDDLPGKQIATVKGTTAANYLESQNITYTAVATINDAYDLLLKNKVQAVVYDSPVLLYYAATRGKGRVQVVGPIFKEETYGIALQTGSALRKPINEALLKLRQDGAYEEIYKRWFGSGTTTQPAP